MDKLLELIGVHGPVAGVFLAMGAVLGFHIKEDRARTGQQDERFRLLEVTRREDLQRVYDAIQHTADQNTEILKLLANRRG